MKQVCANQLSLGIHPCPASSICRAHIPLFRGAASSQDPFSQRQILDGERRLEQIGGATSLLKLARRDTHMDLGFPQSPQNTLQTKW